MDDRFQLASQGVLAMTVLIPLSFWVYSLISWMITDEVEFIYGFFGLVLALMAGGFVIMRAADPISPYVNGAVWTLVLLYPFYLQYKRRRELILLDFEAMENAYEQLSFRPNNLGAVMRIATVAFKYGAREHAILAAEKALEPFPRQHVADDWRQVTFWRSYGDLDETKIIRCQKCGRPVEPGPVFCPECGYWYLLAYVRGQWTDSDMGKRLLVVWLWAILALVGLIVVRGSGPQSVVITASVGILGFCIAGAWFSMRLLVSKL
jgi:hypothetical protein